MRISEKVSSKLDVIHRGLGMAMLVVRMGNFEMKTNKLDHCCLRRGGQVM